MPSDKYGFSTDGDRREASSRKAEFERLSMEACHNEWQSLKVIFLDMLREFQSANSIAGTVTDSVYFVAVDDPTYPTRKWLSETPACAIDTGKTERTLCPDNSYITSSVYAVIIRQPDYYDNKIAVDWNSGFVKESSIKELQRVLEKETKYRVLLVKWGR